MLRFTIRDVLWLMVVVGLACGWTLNRYGSSTLLKTTAFNANTIARSWALDKGSAVKNETHRLRIEMCPTDRAAPAARVFVGAGTDHSSKSR